MKLPHTDWLREPALRQLFAAFESANVPLRCVGGCVRDALLNRPVHDIDLATTLTPDAVQILLKQAGIRTIPTGIDHGTITAIIGTRTFEITSLRRDTSCDGRHAIVEFTTDWHEDAKRRDFTMNALYCDAHGTVTDFLNGADDAKNGRIIFIGNPHDRIREDGLRMLRFFRFNATHGHTEIDASALAACRNLAPMIDALSGERILHEMIRLLSAANPIAALDAMAQCGVAQHVFGEPLAPTPALHHLLSLASSAPDPWLRLALLLPPSACDTLSSPPPACGDLSSPPPVYGGRLGGGILTRWKASRKQRDTLTLYLQTPSLNINDPIALIRTHGRHAARMLWLRDAAMQTCSPENYAAFDAQLAQISVPEFPISGADLIQLGFTQGAALGAALKALETWWQKQDYQPDRDALLERAETIRTE